MRHALALLLLLRHAHSAALRALARPGLRKGTARAGASTATNKAAAAAKPSSWRERRRARAGPPRGGPRPRGRRQGRASARRPARAGGAFELVAGAWLDQPEGWITVGLRGRFEDNCTLSGEITDGGGDIMAACSRFTLQRVDADEAADASIPLAGAWEGVYVCGGGRRGSCCAPSPDHAAFAREVRRRRLVRARVTRSRKMTLNLTWSRRWRRRDAAPPRRRRRGRQEGAVAAETVTVS